MHNGTFEPDQNSMEIGRYLANYWLRDQLLRFFMDFSFGVEQIVIDDKVAEAKLKVSKCEILISWSPMIFMSCMKSLYEEIKYFVRGLNS
jgi:hypothetical protein